ncbi:hypothetical protein Adt_23605 [Abeliophyllum distichum]|uniref:Uncharacterized protein n=1 Tax=Abeliophyllum distichum TaxID=126358 RepID=A0ABD1SBB4_9LAMI
MSFDHEDFQNRSDLGDPASTNGRGDSFAILPKTKAGGRKTGSTVPEMRGLLDQRDAPAVQRLDNELKRSATEASMVPSKIGSEDLVDIRLSYNISDLVTL